jgi:hypothetical protein
LIVALLSPTLIPSRTALKFIAYLAIANSVYMLARYLLGIPMYALGMASSFDSTIVAICYPLVLLLEFPSPSTKWISRAIPVLAIFAAHGSVGVGGLCLGLVILYMRKSWKLLSIPVVLFAIATWLDPLIFSDSLRFICWKWSMNYWAHLPLLTRIFGTGLGTFSILGPYIQILTHSQMNNWYLEMHNDWLQCLFELGYLGLTIIGSLTLYLIYKLYRSTHENSPYLLASVVTYAACALMYYPTRNIISASIGVILIKSALDCDA